MSFITLISTWMLALALTVGQADTHPVARFAMLVRAALAAHHRPLSHESLMPHASLNGVADHAVDSVGRTAGA